MIGLKRTFLTFAKYVTCTTFPNSGILLIRTKCYRNAAADRVLIFLVLEIYVFTVKLNAVSNWQQFLQRILLFQQYLKAQNARDPSLISFT